MELLGQINDRDDGWAQGEPSAAAFENDIFVAWMDLTHETTSIRYSASADGGKTFADSRVLLTRIEYDRGFADPTVVRRRGGEIDVAFLACRSHPRAPKGRACDLVWMQTPDWGQQWTRPRVIAGGNDYRADRPWLATDGQRVVLSWNELRLSGPPAWHVIDLVEWEGDETTASATHEGVISHQPVRLHGLDSYALLQPPATSHVRELRVVRLRDDELEAIETRQADVSAALLKLGTGALSIDPDGTPRVAIPDGDGTKSHLTVYPGGQKWNASKPEGRVAMPWLHHVGGQMLAAWLEDDGAGHWQVQVRCEQDGRLARPVSVTRTFEFDLATRRRWIGDYLEVTDNADGRFLVVWADVTSGDADVYAAFCRCR